MCCSAFGGRSQRRAAAFTSRELDFSGRKLLDSFCFLVANIRYANTREAYARAVANFLDWAESRGVRTLSGIQPVVVAGYIEDLGTAYEPPTVKQHLAAIRMLFDWLVVGQIVPSNPANSVRGPKHVVKCGKPNAV